MRITRRVQLLVGRIWRLLAGRAWRTGTSGEPPSAITELSRALAEKRSSLQLFEKLTGSEQLWWRCCRDAVQTQPSWLRYPDHDRALGLIGDTELVASSGAILGAAGAVDLICQALVMAAVPASPAGQLSEIVARAAACWDNGSAVPTAGAASFTPDTAAASAVPYLRDHVRKVLECLGKADADRGQAMAATCALLLTAGQPDTGRVVRVPVVLARPGERQASPDGVAGTLELREFPPGPSGLFPDPRQLRNRHTDPAFDAGLGLAWQFAADAGRRGRCVLWRLSLDAGVPDYAIDGGSLGAAFAIALRELLRRPRGSRPAPLAVPRAFFIGLRPKCAITGVLAAQRPSAYNQLTSPASEGPWIDKVGGMDAKLAAASAKGLRLVAPAANRADAQPRAAVPVDWAETIHQADRYARRVRPVRTLIAGTALVLTALAVALAAITTVAIGQRRTIVSARDVAASNALVDQSEATGSSDPVLARLEAVAAWRLDPSARAGYAMLSAAVLPWTAVLSSHTADQEHSAVLSPDGNLLAAVVGSGVQLWDVTTRKLITTLVGTETIDGHAVPGSTAVSVAFSPDGTLLAAGNLFGTQLWDVATRKQIAWLPAGSTTSAKDILRVSTVAFSPDGTLLAAGTGGLESPGFPDGGTQLWDIKTRKLITTLPSGTGREGDSIGSVAFSPDGALLAVGVDSPVTSTAPSGAGGGTQLWDIKTRKLITTLRVDALSHVNAVAFNPAGTLLAVGDASGTQLWDVATRKLISTRQFNTDSSVNSVAFAPVGNLLAASTSDGTQLWDTATRNLVTTLPASSGNSVNSVAFSRDGTLLAVGTDNGTWLASLSSMPLPSSAATLPSSSTNDSALAFDPDGTLLAIGTSGGTQLWDTATRNLVTTLPASSGSSVNAVAFSPNGTLLAVAEGNHAHGAVQLWNVTKGKIVTTLPGAANQRADALAFSPDNTLLAIATATTTQIWDTRTRALIATLPFQDTADFAVAFSPDGRLLAVGTGNGTQLWDTRTRNLVTTLPASGSAAVAVAFSPDGTLLAVGAIDGTTYLWNVTERQLTATLSARNLDDVTSVEFSRSGTILLISGAIGVNLWDVNTSQQFDILSPDEAQFATLSHSGSLLAVNSAGGPVKLLKVPFTNNVVAYLCEMAGGPFPPAEWARYARGVPYMKTCQ